MGPVDLLAIASGVVLPLIVNEATKPPAPERDYLDADFESVEELPGEAQEEEVVV